MIQPLLEGFDPDRRPLLFLPGTLIYCCVGITTANGVPLRRLQGYSAGCTLMPVRQCSFGIRGALRAPFATTARFATV
jgi:hypothetical protein